MSGVEILKACESGGGGVEGYLAPLGGVQWRGKLRRGDGGFRSGFCRGIVGRRRGREERRLEKR